jgi:hypothetical protein
MATADSYVSKPPSAPARIAMIQSGPALMTSASSESEIEL